MIGGIPNQPIDFVGDDLIGCEDEKASPLLVALEDDLIFQFTIGRCADAFEYIATPDFISGWLTGGEWSIRRNNACAENGQEGASITFDGLSAVVGTNYEIEVVVNTIGGSGIRVSFGGVDTIIQAIGTHTFILTAVSSAGFSIFLVDNSSSVCLNTAQVYAANTDVQVSLIAPDETEIYSTSLDATPEYFSITGTTVTAIIPMDITGATDCFKVFITDPCEDGYGYGPAQLCSQTIKVPDDCKGTVKIRVCNDYDQPDMGFVAGRFEMRVPMIVILPTFSYDSTEERLSNGYINRTRIDRQEVRELRVNDPFMGYAAHRFFSAIALFDHFYIGEREYSVDVEEYNPNYPDTAQSTGALRLTIRPKQELFRKVLCEPAGDGCNPANDPICNEPDVTITGSFDNGGLYSYNIVLSSMTGFVTDKLIVTVNGVAQAPADFSTAPQDIDIGVYTPGSTIGITITNANDPDCDWTRVYEVPCNCESPLVMHLKGVVAPSADFTAADGEIAVYDTCIAERPSWTIAGGAGLGGVNVLWTGDNWYIYDGTGVGFMSQFGTDYRSPCDVPEWASTTDGVTAIAQTPILVCGGNGNVCAGLNNTVEFAINQGGKTLVVGLFTQYGSTSAPRVTRLNADRSLDTTFNNNIGTGSTSLIRTAAVDSLGRIYVGGLFTSFNGNSSYPYIVRLNTNGTIDTSFNIGTGFNTAGHGTGTILVQADDKVIVIGDFTTYDGVGANRIIRLNTDGTRDAGFTVGTGFNGASNALTGASKIMPDGTILVGSGAGWTQYQGNVIMPGGRWGIARINADGSFNSAFTVGTGFNASFHTIALQSDGKLLVSGTFTEYNGTAVPRFARLNADGTLDASFNTNLGAGFASRTTGIVQQPDGKILVGDGGTYQGGSTYFLTRLNANGTRDVSFNPGPGFDAGVDFVGNLPGNKLLVAGSFVTFDSLPRIRVATLNT